jgi:predicted O-methyltransferase YrrM
MTSRESTSWGGRQDEESARPPRGFKDRALLGAFYVLNGPFLAKSLYGGSKAAKKRLLQLLDLPEDALPHTGSWKADVGLLTFLAHHILAKKPRVVVEFSAGASSLIIARALEKAGVENPVFVSFEQHRDFCEHTSAWLAGFGLESDIRHAPLRPSPGGWPGLWYDHGPLPDGIELMLIDGPHWAIHPFTRGAAATAFGQVAPGGTVMLDDAARPGERIVARRWRREWPDFGFKLLHPGSKGTLVGTRRA